MYLGCWILLDKFLQGVIFDVDKIRQQIPDVSPEKCISVILRHVPREAYRFPSTVDIDGDMTFILVLNAGDDEEYLRKTLKIPDSDNDEFRLLVDHFMQAGVWPTHR